MRRRLAALINTSVLRRRLLVVGLAGLALWFVFLDSHSLLKRIQFTQERAQLRVEVQELREANATLENQLRHGLTDETVERVAREQYGMRRAGETVYPVELAAD